MHTLFVCESGVCAHLLTHLSTRPLPMFQTLPTHEAQVSGSLLHSKPACLSPHPFYLTSIVAFY